MRASLGSANGRLRACAQRMVSTSRRSSISARGVIGDKGLLLLTCMKEHRKLKTKEVIGEGGGDVGKL